MHFRERISVARRKTGDLSVLHIGGQMRSTRRFRSFAALILPLMLTTNAMTQLAPEARAGLWRAQWITSSNAPERDAAVLQFRKVFEIAQVPQRFVVHVSADNQFVLNLNQREVGRGPARGDLAHWKYETYDLAPFLRAGRNEIAAM